MSVAGPVLQILLGLLYLGLLGAEAQAAERPEPAQPLAAVSELLQTIAEELSDPSDQAAMQQLRASFTERGALTDDRSVWMLLAFDSHGALEAVRANAEALLSAPPLLQRAAVLHELEHLKHAGQTRRLLDALGPQVRRGDRAASVSRLQHLVRVLVDDEYRAYRRDILYIDDTVSAHGGLGAYLETLAPAQRLPTARYYQRHVRPFVSPEGRIDERRLRRDFIFLETFPHRHPRYYTAALMWEALQGHIEVRRGPDGRWRPERLLEPTAFLAWLGPS